MLVNVHCLLIVSVLKAIIQGYIYFESSCDFATHQKCNLPVNRPLKLKNMVLRYLNIIGRDIQAAEMF